MEQVTPQLGGETTALPSHAVVGMLPFSDGRIVIWWRNHTDTAVYLHTWKMRTKESINFGPCTGPDF